MKPTKRPKPAFRVEIEDRSYKCKIPWCLADHTKFTWRIIRIRGGKVILSSTSQLYSRRVDAVREAQKLIRACRAGRVEVKA